MHVKELQSSYTQSLEQIMLEKAKKDRQKIDILKPDPSRAAKKEGTQVRQVKKTKREASREKRLKKKLGNR